MNSWQDQPLPVECSQQRSTPRYQKQDIHSKTKMWLPKTITTPTKYHKVGFYSNSFQVFEEYTTAASWLESLISEQVAGALCATFACHAILRARTTPVKIWTFCFPNIGLIQCLLDVQCVRFYFWVTSYILLLYHCFWWFGGGAGAQNLLVAVYNCHAPKESKRTTLPQNGLFGLQHKHERRSKNKIQPANPRIF